MGLQQKSTTVYCDSQGAVHLTKNQMFHERTKHINIRAHFIGDVVVEGSITVQKIPTVENPADMMTKPIWVVKFKHL